MTGGRPVAEKYLKPMTEVKNARMSTAWWLLPINVRAVSKANRRDSFGQRRRLGALLPKENFKLLRDLKDLTLRACPHWARTGIKVIVDLAQTR